MPSALRYHHRSSAAAAPATRAACLRQWRQHQGAAPLLLAAGVTGRRFAERMSDTRPELTVRQQLVQLKDDGNAAYKAGEFAAAFKQYTAALAKAQQEGLVDLDAERSGDSAVQVRRRPGSAPPGC